MYLVPARKQLTLPDFDQPYSLNDVIGLHAVNLDDPYWATHFSEPDDYLSAALHDVNVRWSVLTQREEDAYRKAIRSEDGWQWKVTQRLGSGNS